MLIFNLKRALTIRGVKYATTFFMKHGYSRAVASSLAGMTTVPPKHLEKLCLMLNCTPNDLFDWIPDAEHDKPDYALYELKRGDDFKNFAAITKGLKMKDVMEVLKEMKKTQ